MKRSKYEMKEKKSIQLTFYKEVILVILGAVLTFGFGLVLIDYEAAGQIVEMNQSEDDLLLDAQKYFLLGEYAEAIHIYSIDKMEKNDIALNNIGYMYENGIVYRKDIEKAREYYEKAARLGNIECLEISL